MENIDLVIEQYLMGELSPEQVSSFEQYLASNPAIEKNVQLQRNTIEAIKQTRRLQLKSNLANINPSTVSPITQKIAIIASSFLAASLIGAGAYFSTAKIAKTEVKEIVYETEVITQTNNLSEPEKIELEHEQTLAILNQPSALTENKLSRKQFGSDRTTRINNSNTSNPINPNSKTKFDPTNPNAIESKEIRFGSNGETLEVGKQNSGFKTDKIDYTTDESCSYLGYKYDGKNIILLGKFKEVYSLEQKMDILILRYQNKVYRIVDSDKKERLEKHLVTDKNLLELLK